jgi:fructokinase
MGVAVMRIGIDLGGTKIEAAVLDASGAIVLRHRALTPAGDYAATLAAIAALVASVEAQTGQRASVGVATPGALSLKSGLIKNANSTVLNGKPLDRDLAQCLDRPVRLENDANCFALSEAIDGAGAGARVVFGVIIGTGVGGGLVVDRNLISGRNRIAAEWGHNALPWPRDDERPGHGCYCGLSGCIETFLSGPGLARDYFARKGIVSDGPAIASAAGAGDPPALACLRLYQDRLARSLASVINVVDPDVIVLGGGLSNIAPLYDGLAALVARHVFSDRFDTPVVPAAHGDSSGVRGAAWLWPAP